MSRLYAIYRRTILYRACLKASANGEVSGEKWKMKVVSDHLVHLVLTWAVESGVYDCKKEFKSQQQEIILAILHDPTPELIEHPMNLVRQKLWDILHEQRFNKSRKGRHIRMENKMREEEISQKNIFEKEVDKM